MATIKFLIRSQANKHVPIYYSLSLSRGNVFRLKTGFNIHPKNWSAVKGFPKSNDEDNKKLTNQLKSLEAHLMKSINEAQAKGSTINKQFLENQVNQCFNRVTAADNTLFRNHIQHIIDTASTRKIKGKNKIGLSDNTLKNYNSFLGLIDNYERHLRNPIHFMDIDFIFVEKFKDWLIKSQKYSVNHAGKSIGFLKSISIDAEKHGSVVNPFVHKIEVFSEPNEDRYIITLSFDELDKIKKLDLKSKALINARKWLLLGCEIGQRGEDFLKVTEKNLRRVGDLTVLDLKQGKTKKDVTIPINDRAKAIIEEGFPYRISNQKLGEHIKEIAKEAKLNEKVKGKKYHKDIKRKILGYYPKHELLASHACRRSFATNYYKIIPTTILMGITGHTKESTFLAYINKPKDTDENARLFLDMMKRVGAKG